jgi:arylsulfatase A-like enzyme
VKDLDGNVIADAFGRPGFPNGFSPSATQSLGYAATMLEAGVPVVYLYIEDAHDNHSSSGGTYGPGEAGYVAQLQQYNTAFGKFFARLAADGITKDNTLFVVTPDENDHFVGGAPTPANCDGVNLPCTYAAGQKGEIDALINRLLITQRANSTAFSVHSDDAPTVYINGNPAPTDAVTRTMEHDLDALVATNPMTGTTDKLSRLLADQAEMKLLHMVTASPARTPTVTMFGNDNYFFETGSGGACATQSDCIFVGPGFAWNHGDFQKQITRTWVAMVGPGVQPLGRNDEVFTDHADVRPTIMALLGLKDDYVHEGRVVAEWMQPHALPDGIRDARENFTELAEVFKQLDAPKGELGRASLRWSNRSVTAPDKVYARYLRQIGEISAQRDELAGQIKTVLDNAAFHNQPVSEGAEDELDHRAKALIDQVKDLAEREHDLQD